MKELIEQLDKAIAELEAIKKSFSEPYHIGEYYYFSNYEPFDKEHPVIYGKLQEIVGLEYKCNNLWWSMISETPIKKNY